MLAYTRYEQQPFPGNRPSYQPRSIQVVELASLFDDRPANVIASGEIVGQGAMVLALSWAPDSQHLMYTLVDTPEGSPPRVVEVAESMALDEAPAIPDVVELRGCAEATYLGDTGLVLSVRAQRAVMVNPESGAEVRDLFSSPELNCVSQAPVSDRTGRHVLYAAGGALYTWSEGPAMPMRLAEGVTFAAWVPPSS